MRAYHTFGYRVLIEMRRHRMEQKRLAVLTGICQGNLSKLIGGLTPDPRLSTVIRIADALGCSVGHLCNGVLPPSKLRRDRRAD